MEANGLSSGLIQIEALRICDRRLVVQTRLRTLAVVEDLDVFADRVPRLLARAEALMSKRLGATSSIFACVRDMM